jgi:hypothetical protein
MVPRASVRLGQERASGGMGGIARAGGVTHQRPRFAAMSASVLPACLIPAEIHSFMTHDTRDLIRYQGQDPRFRFRAWRWPGTTGTTGCPHSIPLCESTAPGLNHALCLSIEPYCLETAVEAVYWPSIPCHRCPISPPIERQGNHPHMLPTQLSDVYWVNWVNHVNTLTGPVRLPPTYLP